MSKKNNISIVVPIYNAEKYLRKCIDSLLSQTMKEIEFILINDGSTDKTEEIIKNYQDNRIKYFKNKNQGIGKTRNFGIDHSEGKYIMFLDSDDYLESNACEMLLKKAEEENLDMVICDFQRVYDDGRKEIEKIPSFQNSNLKENPKLLNIINLGPCNKIYKSKMIKENNIRFAEDLKYEDFPFVIETIRRANKIGHIQSVLHNYVIHGNSETTIRDERCFDILKIIKMTRESLKEEKYLIEELNKLTVRVLTNYTIQQRVQKNKEDGMKFIDKTFDYLKKEVPDYKNNKYYQDRNFLKRIIEKNKLITKIYCKLYRK